MTKEKQIRDLAQGVLHLQSLCKDITTEEDLKCHHLDEIADLARQVCADTKDTEGKGSEF